MRCPCLRDLPPPPLGKTGWPWTEESSPLPDKMQDGQPWPRVSIVTPSYNQGQFIEETIRSILLQGYPDLEYIIMDGGSTDSSIDIIRKYEPWLAHWVSQPDNGQTHAINEGWEHATGQIMAYINSDDYYLPGAVAAAAKEVHANYQAGMVYGTAIVVDVAGNTLRIWKGQPFNLETMLTVGSIVPQPATFFTKHALKSVGYLDEQWHMIMDYELCLRVALQFATSCLPKTFAKFRDHSQSKSHSHYEEMAEELIQWLSTFSPSRVLPDQWRVIKRIMLSRIHYEWAISYLSRGREHTLKALLQLIKSLFQYPPFALKRPLDTAYIVKEIFLAYIITIYARISMQPRKRRVVRE